MATPTLLITVRGPPKTVDLEVPGGVPIGELLPILREIWESVEDIKTVPLGNLPILQVAGTHAPLSTQQTLIDAGLFDGAMLLLQSNKSSASFSASVDTHLEQFRPRSIRPTEESGGIGITWETL